MTQHNERCQCSGRPTSLSFPHAALQAHDSTASVNEIVTISLVSLTHPSETWLRSGMW